MKMKQEIQFTSTLINLKSPTTIDIRSAEHNNHPTISQIKASFMQLHIRFSKLLSVRINQISTTIKSSILHLTHIMESDIRHQMISKLLMKMIR